MLQHGSEAEYVKPEYGAGRDRIGSIDVVESTVIVGAVGPVNGAVAYHSNIFS